MHALLLVDLFRLAVGIRFNRLSAPPTRHPGFPSEFFKMGMQERIKEIEFEMSRTQKNKATEYHLGRLKARLAILRGEIMKEAAASKKGTGEGFGASRKLLRVMCFPRHDHVRISPAPSFLPLPAPQTS